MKKIKMEEFQKIQEKIKAFRILLWKLTRLEEIVLDNHEIFGNLLNDEEKQIIEKTMWENVKERNQITK
jgi:hypothetical protein